MNNKNQNSGDLPKHLSQLSLTKKRSLLSSVTVKKEIEALLELEGGGGVNVTVHQLDDHVGKAKGNHAACEPGH